MPSTKALVVMVAVGIAANLIAAWIIERAQAASGGRA